MQVLLNGEELDVRFESEKSLAEVLDGIINWMESDGYYLERFTLDGKRYVAPDQLTGEWDFDLFQQELGEVGVLELRSVPMQAYSGTELNKAHESVVAESENTVLESLKILGDYFRIAKEAFEDRKFIFLKDFFSDTGTLLELLERGVSRAEMCLSGDGDARNEWEIGQGNHENPLITELKASLELWCYFQDGECNAEAVKQWQGEAVSGDKDRMSMILENISQLLNDLYEDYGVWLSRSGEQSETRSREGSDASPNVELTQPRTFCDMNVHEIKVQLEQKIRDMEESVSRLQSGEIQQSLYCVSELSLLLEQLLQQGKIKDNDTLVGLFIRLGPFLHDLTSAIENMDTVTIGDLVEYEIIPLTEQIISELA
ncbi:hypothetical protein P0082_06540 [Candidatus Haliotispira prima]|uniref:Uncharacterized protein n=1 Tax=Candidatus Haliotispira prima TaxID=3034016 RepID=A0ABY8MH03_9SPIO|nr:hypothetical protein P0082_06540 [Candidatus Haliotispira prima]